VPMVSAVVASKDRRAGVERLIGDLGRQGYPAGRLEIVVVDDGSASAYKLGQGVRVIRHERSLGAQRSRNEGVAAARGELVLMLDDDIELEGDDFIRRGVEVLGRQEGVALVAGRKMDVTGENGRARTAEFSVGRLTGYSGDLVRGEAAGGEVDWPNQVYLVRRAALLEIGGYDGIYGLNGGHSFREESDVHARLRARGYRLWHEPRMGVRHHITSEGGHGASVGRRLFWIAHNHIIFLRRHVKWWRLRALGFLIDVGRYSWVQGRFRYLFSMLGGYAAGWRNALRDRGCGKNPWLEQR